ncbi:MAG: pyroglutamyl-peptidase I [Clostridia bacterium]|nr:pyroglutamyl-peptidase I [Clostridia bacterium]
MPRLLITGFEPFGGEKVNPAWEAVRALPDTLDGWQIVKLQVPVVFGLAGETVLKKAAELQADAVIAVGMAAGRAAVTPELVAINRRYAEAPDNAGQRFCDTPCDENGKNAYFATLPVRRMAEAIREKGLKGAVSTTAGTYVCNDLMYALLRAYENTAVRAGFIHVPCLPEQAGDKYPFMTEEEIVMALEAAIGVL